MQSCMHFSQSLSSLFCAWKADQWTPSPFESSWGVEASTGGLRARGAWGLDYNFSSSLLSGWPLRKITAPPSWPSFTVLSSFCWPISPPGCFRLTFSLVNNIFINVCSNVNFPSLPCMHTMCFLAHVPWKVLSLVYNKHLHGCWED